MKFEEEGVAYVTFDISQFNVRKWHINSRFLVRAKFMSATVQLSTHRRLVYTCKIAPAASLTPRIMRKMLHYHHQDHASVSPRH
jgi:hypothetical protein